MRFQEEYAELPDIDFAVSRPYLSPLVHPVAPGLTVIGPRLHHYLSPGSNSTRPLANISTATAASSSPMMRIAMLTPVFPSHRLTGFATRNAPHVVSEINRQHAMIPASVVAHGPCMQIG